MIMNEGLFSSSLLSNFSISRERERIQNCELMNIEETSLLTSATDDEIHVAQILLDLPALIRARELLGPGIEWGRRKRRSALDEDEEVELPYQKKTNDVGVRLTPRKPEAAAVFSPITPLAYSPSESDDQRSNKTPKFKSRKVYLGMIGELSHCGDMLKGELVKVRDHRNKLLADNAKLKAALQEAVEQEKLRLEKKLNENLVKIDEMGRAKIVEMGRAQLYNGLGSSNNVGARCAEARRRRMDIMRIKSSFRRRRAASIFSRTR